MEHRIALPLTKKYIEALKSGDTALLSGIIYTARDAAHKRMMRLLSAHQPLPFPISDATIYYVGPTPAKPGQIIGSAGPTTSCRMDAYSPILLDLGQRGVIGKGRISADVIEAIRRNCGVYFGATGGAGALIRQCIKKAEVVAFDDLGPEAIYRLEVLDFPVVVIVDCHGNNLYDSGPEAYLRSIKTLPPL